MAAAEQEASSTNNRKIGLAVDVEIPRDGTGSHHTQKTVQIHRRPTQWHCKGANRMAVKWYLSLSWASDPVLT